MRRRLLWLAFLAALAGSPAAAISLGQVDAFQSGTLGWGGRSSPTNVATGGPAGSGDAYLQIRATAFNLGANNTTQWSGNYLSAGVTGLDLHLNNFGPSQVALRLSLFGPGGTFTTTNEIVLSAGSGWQALHLGLGELDLTRTVGAGTLAETLAAVDTLLLRHDPDPISPSGEQNSVTATLGIDNITAVPEPASGLLLALGIAAVACGRRVASRCASS
jgi:hypothetical protein